MGKKPSTIRWRALREPDRKRLLHLVAQWFANEKCTHSDIAAKMENWVKKNAPGYYNPAGDYISTSFVGRRITEAAQRYGFLQVGRFYEQELTTQIQTLIKAVFPLSENKVQIIVAPDRAELLRYVWLDLDRHLIEGLRKLNTKKKSVIVGVSGGRTMLALAKATTNLTDLAWEYVPANERARVIICSLTSGGIRSNIAALSDTVAANMAQYLGAQTRGLLGPGWFADSSALAAFRNDPDVKDHIQLVKQADIILTSVGYLGDTDALMRQLLSQAGQSKFVDDRPNLADMLYNCYDGITGQAVEMPEAIADHLFSVIDLKQLSTKVQEGSLCIVLAVGENKGRHALPGILRKQMASHIYMDRACAEGLVEAFS